MSQEITVIVKWWWWWVRRTLERQAHGSRRGSRLESFCVQLQMGVLQSRILSASLKTLRVPADASRAMLVCNLMRQSRARVREIHHGWKFYGPRDKIKCTWSRDYWRNWRTSVLNTISCFSFFTFSFLTSMAKLIHHGRQTYYTNRTARLCAAARSFLISSALNFFFLLPHFKCSCELDPLMSEYRSLVRTWTPIKKKKDFVRFSIHLPFSIEILALKPPRWWE